MKHSLQLAAALILTVSVAVAHADQKTDDKVNDTVDVKIDVKADQKVDALIKQVIVRARQFSSLGAEYDITCQYGGTDWTIHSRTLRCVYRFGASQINQQIFSDDRPDSMENLNYLYPTGLFLTLARFFSPFLNSPTYTDPLSAPHLFPFPEPQAYNGLREAIRLLPDAEVHGVVCNVIEMTLPDFLDLPIPKLTGTLSWYIGPDQTLRRIAGQFRRSNGDPLTMDAVITYREPKTGSARPPSPPPIHVLELPATARTITGFAYSPDRKLFAVANEDGSVTLWDAATWKPLHSLAVSNVPAQSIAFTPDSRTLAVLKSDGTIIPWDVATAAAGHPLNSAGASIQDFAFSPDRSTLATYDIKVGVKVWNAATGVLLFNINHPNACRTVFSPDGRMVATASYNLIRLWDAKTGHELKSMPIVSGNNISINGLPITFSPDSRLVAVGDNRMDGYNGFLDSDDALIKQPAEVWVYSTSTGELLQSLQGALGSINEVAFSPDGKLLAAGDSDSLGEAPGKCAGVVLWDTTTWHLSQVIAIDGIASVDRLAFAPDGKTLATSSSAGIKFWKVPTR